MPVLQTDAERQRRREQIDPRRGPWRSEVFAEAAGKRLEELAEVLIAGNQSEELSGFLGDDFIGTPLRPASLEEKFNSQGITVRRAVATEAEPGQGHTGIAGATAMFGELIHPLGKPGSRRIAIKIVGVKLGEGGRATSSVTYDAAGPRLQQTGRWECGWQQDGSGGRPRIVSLAAVAYEEVELANNGRWFSDLTATVFGDVPAFREQIGFGLNHWLGRIDRAYGLDYFRRSGLAVGDADGDGRDDLYFPQSGGLPNRLFLRREDGTVEEASANFAADWLDHTSSALFVDLDNDGDQDLALAAGNRVQLLENDSNHAFRPRAALALIDNDTLSLSAADYDGDSLLDLFVCVGFATKSAHAKQGRVLPGFVFHDSRDGGGNALFRNRGAWQFTDVTAATGLGAGNNRHSLAASWEDYDQDGDPDLYIANDYGPNSLYCNEGGKFREIAAEAGVLDYGAGMSVSWGDYDRDGWSDLYVANMFSYAGNRIAGQPEFLAEADGEFRALNRRFAKGNSLFRNSPPGVFRETGADAGVERGRWAWGSLFADFNNDGWQDLFVANGYITTPDQGDL